MAGTCVAATGVAATGVAAAAGLRARVFAAAATLVAWDAAGLAGFFESDLAASARVALLSGRAAGLVIALAAGLAASVRDGLLAARAAGFAIGLRAGGETFAGAVGVFTAPRFFAASAALGAGRADDLSPFASFPAVWRAPALLDFDSAPPPLAGRFPGGLLVTTTVGRS